MKIKDSDPLLDLLVQARRVLREPDPRSLADARARLAGLRGLLKAPNVDDIVATYRPGAEPTRESKPS